MNREAVRKKRIAKENDGVLRNTAQNEWLAALIQC